ncbi:MAG: DNA topoisomerase 4 subunit A [Ruminococcus sp.]|nr:DNA topoisomerase 4 subunit A [Ruminococcus sp.]
MQNDVKQELSTNFIEYAVAVNTDRAIPDSKSGLKPVAKRILWAAYEGGRTSSKPHVKCARIVGDTMGAYHPHGDSSIYGALVRLSQNWVMRYPLIDFHGNNGNIAGDGPAHMRYTEARLAKITEDGLLAGIKKKNVDFMPNYDETEDEPVTLPAIFPNLLCNPNTGIGVAMACNWLPHNLNEVAQAIFDYMDGNEPTLPGPDFPTGGLIINKDDIPNIMKSGHGSVKIRGKYKIEKQNIVFYEIPYGTSIEGLLSEIGEVCDKKEIEGVSEIRDESNKKGLRIVIQCQKDVNPESIVKKLFNKTNLQTSISYNQVALVNKTPTELNLKDCIKIYIEHNISCIVKEAQFDLEKAKARQHIVEGLLKALEDIDNIITLIKSSSSAATAKESLMSQYKFSEVQAKAIIDMKLGKLAGLEKIELQQEYEELIQTIEELNALINNSDKQYQEIKNRLSALVKKYGDVRRTELTQIEVPKEEKEIAEVVPEDVVVILTQTGDIKRIPRQSFRTQKRGGKGVKNEDEAILNTISTNTIDNLMLFTSKGKMYRLLVDNVPAGTAASRGINVSSLVNMEPDEKVIAMTSLYHQTNAKYAVFITKQGLIKKTFLDEYFKVKRSTGIAAINIKDGDSLANVTFLDEEDVIIITKKGMAIHFATNEINPIGRVTAGVRSIKLMDGDEVLIGLPIHKETDMVAIITTKGYGKKCKINEFPWQLRGGKGVCVYKVSGSTGDIAGAAMVDDNDSLLLVGKPNSICIPTTELPSLSRISMGNIMIKNNVTSVVKL